MYRSIVEDSAIGVFVAERASRRILYMNDALREMYDLKKQKNNLNNILNVVSDKNLILKRSELNSLSRDYFSEFHIVRHGNQHLGVKAKALLWNGVDAYILYITDETNEYNHQQRMQDLVNDVPGGIGIFEINHGELQQVFLNESYYRLVCDTFEDRKKRTSGRFINSVHPDDRKAIEKAVQEVVNGADEVNFDFRTQSGRGEYIWVHLAASIASRDNDKIKLYCCFMDIREAVVAKEALQKSNEAIQQKYEQELARRTLLEKGSFASITANITKGIILEFKSVSNTKIDYSGMEFDKAVQQFLSRVPDERYKKMLLNIMQRDSLLSRVKCGITEGTVEYRSYQKNNELHWIRAFCSVTEDIVSGDIVSYICFYDIDDEKKAHLAAESVVDEEIEYVMLVNVHTQTARFIRIKQSIDKPIYKKPFHFSDVKKFEAYNFVQKSDIDAVNEFLDLDYLIKQLEKKTVATVLYRQIRENGVVLRKKARAFYLDETHDDIVVARRDITDLYEEEQRQKAILEETAAQAVQASLAKSKFLARMSHDMRTPMNGILGLAQLSQDEDDVSVLKENISKIKESGEYLLSLINDTLDFQKIESGKMTVEKQIVSATAILRNILEIIRPAAAAKNIDFQVENVNTDLDWYISADPVRLKQIFINLLSNAVKFTPDGGTIKFSFECLGRDGMVSHDKVVISDNGIGMSEEFIKNRLFQPFSQEHNEVSAKYVGSGLGLSIVNSLVSMMGGKIEVDSELGVGTTFTLYLDFERVDRAQAVSVIDEREKSKHEIQQSLNGKNILLVEDHPLNAEISTKLLEKAGCNVVWADNGQRGVEEFLKSNLYFYDAILMDIRMPVMNGFEATRAIRESMREDAVKVPIIAVTANAYDEDVNKSIEVGMNGHIAKPIEPYKLYSALNNSFINRK